MAFTTTIMRAYWNMKMKDAKLDRGGLFIEYKEPSEYWNKRLHVWRGDEAESEKNGIFLVGSEVHRVEVVWISKMKPEQVPLIYRDALVLGGSYVWAIVCRVRDGA